MPEVRRTFYEAKSIDDSIPKLRSPFHLVAFERAVEILHETQKDVNVWLVSVDKDGNDIGEPRLFAELKADSI